MLLGKIVKWTVITAAVASLVAFRGDLARYVKMKRL
jgi:hypothetical protein